MQDAWRAYLELAMGLTEAPRKKAQDAVRRLAGSGGATAAQLQTLGEELLSTGAANREALTKLVRFEVDRALGAVGLATADEVAELTRRVHELERQLRETKAMSVGVADRLTSPPPAAGSGTPASAPGHDLPGAAEPATSAGAAEPVGEPPAAPDTPDNVTGKAIAKKTVAGRAVAKTVTKKTVAKKAVAKKAVVRKPPATVTRTSEVGDDEPARPAKATAPARRPEPGGAG